MFPNHVLGPPRQNQLPLGEGPPQPPRRGDGKFAPGEKKKKRGGRTKIHINFFPTHSQVFLTVVEEDNPELRDSGGNPGPTFPPTHLGPHAGPPF